MKTDFSIQVKKDKKIRIVQLSDMQIIDASQRRYSERLDEWEITNWAPEREDYICFDRIKKQIAQLKPDAIIVTGDLVYGEFDDSGRSLDAFIGCMSSLGIPWMPVYGNHDNESRVGVTYQCEHYANAENCLFARGNVSGNCNYTVGFYDGEELLRVLYMMDSHGCSGDDPSICHMVGFAPDQIEWLKASADKAGRVNGFVCCHIPSADFADAIVNAGYQSRETVVTFDLFEFDEAHPAKNGDSGYKCEAAPCTGQHFKDLFKEYGIDGEFGGHYHKDCMSVLDDGIRYTLGVKTGLYDYHYRTGCTVIDFEQGMKNFTVTPCFEEKIEVRED